MHKISTIILILSIYSIIIFVFKLSDDVKEKTGILNFGKCCFFQIFIMAWFDQIMTHHTIIYWRIVNLFK